MVFWSRCTRLATRRLLAVFVAVVGLATACGDDGPPLSPQAEVGRDIARSSGCAACHGRNGGGGVGPSWQGLFGTEEELETGDFVLVDEDYIRRSITDPSAEIVTGYNIVMPENNLDDEQIDAVIAYIRELG